MDQDRKRTLTARSVLASALLGESPPRLAVRRLVRVAALFGINENQTRVALSRMAARGEVVSDGQGTYALAGRLLDRAGRLAVARTASRGPFDGTWHLVVVTSSGDTASVRLARREMLRAARLAELRDGVWLRPANLAVELDPSVAAASRRFRAAPDGDPTVLAGELFDLAGWAARAQQLDAVLAATSLDGDAALAEGFVRNAQVLRHLQRDPLLPDELVGANWPGPALRARYESFDAQYRALLAHAHHRAVLASR